MNRFFYFVAITVLLSLLLTSCKNEDENKDSSVVSGTIIGEHAQWTEVSASFDIGETWAETSPISDKKFSIKLPIPKAEYLETVQKMVLEQVINIIPEDFKNIIEETLINKISDVIAVDDVNAKGRTALLYVRKEEQKELLSLIGIDGLDVSTSTVQYMYVDNNAKVSGELDESFEVEGINVPVKVLFDLQMNKGWNSVLFNLGTSLSRDLKITVKTGNAPTYAVWQVVKCDCDE